MTCLMSSPVVPITLEGPQIRKAIAFHLIDEKWFETIPDHLNQWLIRQISDDKKITINRRIWTVNKSGTHRLLWIMVTANVDPFEMCKWAKGEQIVSMHRRFSNIIDSWKASKHEGM